MEFKKESEELIDKLNQSGKKEALSDLILGWLLVEKPVLER